MIILGLDISTTCTGICIYENNKLPILTHIKTKEKTVYDKAKSLKKALSGINQPITHIAVEAPIIANITSANTTSKLIEMNSITCYILNEMFNIEPTKIVSQTARYTCGIKINRTQPHKLQVINHMVNHDLSMFHFPKTKHGNYIDWVGDEIDAYVLSKACYLINTKPGI